MWLHGHPFVNHPSTTLITGSLVLSASEISLVVLGETVAEADKNDEADEIAVGIVPLHATSKPAEDHALNEANPAL